MGSKRAARQPKYQSDKIVAIIVLAVVFVVLLSIILFKVYGKKQETGTLMHDEANISSETFPNGAGTDSEGDVSSDSASSTEDTEDEDSSDDSDDESTDDGEEESTQKDISYISSKPKDLGSYDTLDVYSATSSSELVQEGKDINNSAYMLVDGDEETSWQEGSTGYGIGEYVDIYLYESCEISYIRFKLGNWRNSKYYYANAKPKKLKITVWDDDTGEEYSQSVKFPNSDYKADWVKVEGLGYTSHVRLTIESVYKGNTYKDTCISEVGFYGNY